MSAGELYLRITNRINETSFWFNNIKINTTKLLAYKNNTYLDLSQIEYKLLYLPIKSKGEVISRDVIKKYIWSNAIVLDKTINSHLTNLRLKIEDKNIKVSSVKNVGIKLQYIES